ncbi:hemophore-related protein [Mycobacterium sp. 2YAF39]|uniref:hemophore-related protein n=1 Tax=Mycobacterium sp. 2YAF39 TaxID=3233033 RepID=UPI003F9D11B6
MFNSSSKKLIAAAIGGLAVTFAVGTGVASADPLIDTTCSYPQVIAALNTENPALAQKFNANPLAAAMLGNFLSAAPGDRVQLVQEYQATSWGQKYFGEMASIASSCNNY